MSERSARPARGAREGGRWLTPANGLTAVRLACAPLVAFCVLHGADGAAGVLFALAVATDFADGALARRRGETSALGGLLDHATDALFCSTALAALAALGTVPAVLPVLVAAAFLQYALDSRALAGRPLRGSSLGRWNGVAYFVLVGIPVIRDALCVGWPGPELLRLLGWALVGTTLASMLDRALALLRPAP